MGRGTKKKVAKIVCPDCGTLLMPEYLSTHLSRSCSGMPKAEEERFPPEYIEEQCREIRKGWSKKEFERRVQKKRVPWKPPIGKIDLENRRSNDD